MTYKHPYVSIQVSIRNVHGHGTLGHNVQGHNVTEHNAMMCEVDKMP